MRGRHTPAIAGLTRRPRFGATSMGVALTGGAAARAGGDRRFMADGGALRVDLAVLSMSPRDEMPPRAFGKYEVLARLATGGAASIFLARQPGPAGFAKLVCLKTLLPDRASDSDFMAMFLDEARLAARLNHPNCVQIYELGKARGVYYISMEYIFGETLWNLLMTVTRLRMPLPAPEVAHIIASVCDGLHHAHELRDSSGRPYQLVHRDVSPQNIMVTFEGQAKVVDFGIAKAKTGREPTQSGLVKGKLSYMSPEQIAGSPVDRRSDIYSLGIVMFECLASRRLYRGGTPEDIARLILEHRAPRLRDVVPETPAVLDEVCAKALSRQRDKRFQTAQEMSNAIRVYLDSVRYNQSSAALARLMAARFGSTIAKRRTVYEGALSEGYIEADLLAALDARPVRDLDLVSDAEDDEVVDLGETQEIDEAPRGAMDTPPPSVGARIGAIQDSEETNIDLVTPLMEDMPPLRSRPGRGPSSSSRGRASEVRVTPIEGSAVQPDPAVVRRFHIPRSRSTPDHRDGAQEYDTLIKPPHPGESRPSYGGAAAALEARLGGLFGKEDPHRSDPDAPGNIPALVKGAREQGYDRAAATGAKLIERTYPPLSPPPLPRAPAPADADLSEESRGLFDRPRFSLAVVLAALAFGISVGMVLGVLAARWMGGLGP